MTRRMTQVSSTKWTGILLIFFITRLSQSQLSVSLRQGITNSSDVSVDLSGNHTILRKSDQEVDGAVHLAALNNDRERQTPFYSTTKSMPTSTITLSTSTKDSFSSTNTKTNSTTLQGEQQLNNETEENEEKQLPINNVELEKKIKLQKINSTLIKTETKPDEKSLSNNSTYNNRKNLFEKLINQPHLLVNNGKKSQLIQELSNKDDNEDLYEKFENQEPTTSRFPTELISLINDTMVNYKKNSTKNFEMKPKDPKDEIELINNPILPKSMRISDPEISKESEHKDENKTVLITSEKENNVKHPSNLEKLGNTTVGTKEDEKSINLTPKGRTISFGGINRFSSTEEKAIGGVSASTKEHNERGLTTEVRPYPYLKNIQAISIFNANNKSSLTRESDEIFALENTIAKNNDDKKLVITEPSVVLDNSIKHQIKPINPKRSGNFSINNSEISIIPKIPEINLNSSLPLNAKIKDIINDIPRNEEIKKTTLDLTENGLLESPDKNLTLDILKSTPMLSIDVTESPTQKIPDTNSTNLFKSKTTDKTHIQNSKLTLSSLNVTGDSTIQNYSITTTPSSFINNPNTRKFDAENQQNSNLSSISRVHSNFTISVSPPASTTENIKLTVLPTVDKLSPIIDNNISSVSNNSSTNLQENAGNLKNINIDAGRGFDLESTTSAVEYEFVGLTDVTESSESVKNATNIDEMKSVMPVTSTESSMNFSFPNLGVNWTSTGEIIINSTTKSDLSNDSKTEMTTIQDRNMESTTELTYSEDMSGTTDNGFIDTSLTTISTSVDYPNIENATTIMTESTTTAIIDGVMNTTIEITTDYDNNYNFNSSNYSNVTIISVNSTSMTPTLPTTKISAPNDGNFSMPNVDSSTELVENGQKTSQNDGENGTTVAFTGEVVTMINPEGEASSSSTSESSFTTFTVEPSTTFGTTLSTVEVVSFIPEDVSMLVAIVVDCTWTDFCPQFGAFNQKLAEWITSGADKTILPMQIHFQKNPCTDTTPVNAMDSMISTIFLYIVDENGNFDPIITKSLPGLYSTVPFKFYLNIRSVQLIPQGDSGNAIAVIVISCVALLCLVLLAGLLFIMRKRQTRFNYGERCRPVSLDAYSLDSVSAYNSVRRKGAARASKRSYGNPTFEDSSAIPSHPLNFAGLSSFCNEENAIHEEFISIPQVTARIDELPPGTELKNRYANVVPLPETRVVLSRLNNDPLSEYINASYVRGPKNATKYYIACQAPMENTVTDFWRMVWEQQSKVIIMLTDLIENGVEKCEEYIPPSEVTDCHRLYGDYQVTLKKRETKEKYAISTLHLKNLENNTYREVFHIWYLWPAIGIQKDAAGLIAVILEARALQRGGPGPIVVHCSPGTGRTGTLIALDLGIRQYEITRTVDVPRVVYTIRRDRAGAVQTKEQYAFVYKALNLYATKLAGGGLEST